MGTRHQQAPLVVILGETASGKSALALELAERYNCELICADSRTVYRGMDIGTAKPSREERAKVSHYLLDVVDPNQKFSVADFKAHAERLIDEIYARGRIPIIVGGTGLYIDSVLFDFEFAKAEAERDEQNPRHLKEGNDPFARDIRSNTLVLGIHIEKQVLEERIKQRVNQMVASGLEEEVRHLAELYGWQAEAMTGVGYREWRAYFEGSQSLVETAELISIHTRQYAKRQRTWFKRNKHINWVSDRVDVQQKVMTFLQQFK